MTPLVFIGARPFPEQVEIVCDINALEPAYEIVGILDDDISMKGRTIENAPVLGDLSIAGELNKVQFVLCIGTNKDRGTLASVIQRLNLPIDRFETLIHPSATVYTTATIGAGSIIYAGSVIGNGTRIGAFCKIIWNAVIGADNIIGQGTSCCPNVTTCSGVRIGQYCFLGSSCTVTDELEIGPMAGIGAGTVVTRDVPAGAFIFGNPPKIIDRQKVPANIAEDWKHEREAHPE